MEEKIYKISVLRKKDVLVQARTQMMAMEIADLNLKSKDFSQSINEFSDIKQIDLSDKETRYVGLPLFRTVGDGDKETLLLGKILDLGLRKEQVEIKYVSKPSMQGWLIDVDTPFEIEQVQALMQCFGKESGKFIAKDAKTGLYKFRLYVKEDNISYKPLN